MSWGYNPKPRLLYVAGCSGENVAQLALRLIPASRHERNMFLCQEDFMIDSKQCVHLHYHHPAPKP